MIDGVHCLRRKYNKGSFFQETGIVITADRYRSFLHIDKFQKIVPVGGNGTFPVSGATAKSFNRRAQHITVFK